MQPYRLALASANAPSCLDAPIRACESPPRRKWRLEMLTAAVIVVAGSLGVYAGRALGHRGHVEIAPSAIALARARVREPHAREKRQVPARALPPPIDDHALVHGMHDAKAAVAYAKKLASLGFDLTIVDVTMSPKAREGQVPLLDALTPITWVPRYDAAHDLAALEIGRIPPASAIAAVGLERGDRIVAIDGWDYSRDDVDPVRAHAASSSTIEVVRSGRHILFSIHWRAS